MPILQKQEKKEKEHRANRCHSLFAFSGYKSVITTDLIKLEVVKWPTVPLTA